MEKNYNLLFQINDKKFYEEYKALLINRLTHSNMSLETDLGNADDSKNAIKLRDNMNAFDYLLNNFSHSLTEQTIKTTANIVNKSAMFISEDYRKTGNFIAETSIPITKPSNIREDIVKLIYKYQNIWNKLDPIEREARFHIDFIKIHPFEDGNGRTSRLLLNFNLLRQGIAPVIITNDLLEFYQEYIKNTDYETMTKLFKNLSQKEERVISELERDYLSNTEVTEKVGHLR